jgi:ubiquinone/menaquinone biosynthesis C-methylase UbiE
MQATPFDMIAKNYDADFTNSAIGKLQRSKVWACLVPLLNERKTPLRILEINCGTGQDALQLAGIGHSVVATDASPAMIDIAKEKLQKEHPGITQQPQFMVCSFASLHEKLAPQKFDLVLSNFGGLNCISNKEIAALGQQLFSLLTEKGMLVVTVMGNCCLWEIVHYCSQAKLRTAFRRLKKTVDFSAGGQSMPVYYYSPGALQNLLSPEFVLQQQLPVGLFIPPSYLEKNFLNRPRHLARLSRWEEKFSHPRFSFLADHYCSIFKRNNMA